MTVANQNVLKFREIMTDWSDERLTREIKIASTVKNPPVEVKDWLKDWLDACLLESEMRDSKVHHPELVQGQNSDGEYRFDLYVNDIWFGRIYGYTLEDARKQVTNKWPQNTPVVLLPSYKDKNSVDTYNALIGRKAV